MPSSGGLAYLCETLDMGPVQRQSSAVAERKECRKLRAPDGQAHERITTQATDVQSKNDRKVRDASRRRLVGRITTNLAYHRTEVISSPQVRRRGGCSDTDVRSSAFGNRCAPRATNGAFRGLARPSDPVCFAYAHVALGYMNGANFPGLGALRQRVAAGELAK